MVRDYTQALNPDAAKGLRIGVPRKHLFGSSPVADALVEKAIAVLKSLGAVVIDPVDLSPPDALGKDEFQVLLYEFKADLNSYLQGLGPGAPVKSLKDVIAFNDAHRDRVMPYLGQEIFIDAETKGPLTAPDYVKVLAASKKGARELGIDKVMTAHKLDALVAPTSGPASLRIS